MGQTSSTNLEFDQREIAPSRRFSFTPSGILSSMEENNDVFQFVEDLHEGHDYTANLPDECLASIFHFLSSGDRNRCSLVCRRWRGVDGQNRHRLSLDAKAEILPCLTSLLVRFDSITKLTLRCDRKSVSINDDGLILISLRCRNLARLKLRGCYEVTDYGMTRFAVNCRGLKKLSLGSCMFGAEAMNAVLNYCSNLEALLIKRLRGLHDGSEMIGPGSAASSLKSIFLKELINGQCFGPLIIGSKKLKTLKLIRCLGDWDHLFETMRNQNKSPSLTEIHLERLQVSDIGLSAISNCLKLETLHIIKTPECSNFGLFSIAEKCGKLRKLYVDGWRTNRIGDEGLIAIAKQCDNLQELVLIGLNPTCLSLEIIASNCQKLERLALCGSATIGDAEIACIASKCAALKKLSIKSCPISNLGIESIAFGFPNLAKIKVRKCRGVTGEEAAEWLKERRGSLIANWDGVEFDRLEGNGNIDGGVQQSGMDIRGRFVAGEDEVGPGSSNGRLVMLRTRLGLLVGRNFAACLSRWSSNSDSNFIGNL